jgi:hypothetical protein
MTRSTRFLALVAIAALLVPTVARAQSDQMVLTGTLVDNAGLRPCLTTAPVTIRIDRFSSDEAASALAAAPDQGAPDALMKALAHDRVGMIQVSGSIGFPIAFARRITDESGSHLLLIIQRPISPREIWYSARSVRYPYTVVEIDLGHDGRGSGDVLPAARLRVRKDGQVELINLLDLPMRLLAVHEMPS